MKGEQQQSNSAATPQRHNNVTLSKARENVKFTGENNERSPFYGEYLEMRQRFINEALKEKQKRSVQVTMDSHKLREEYHNDYYKESISEHDLEIDSDTETEFSLDNYPSEPEEIVNYSIQNIETGLKKVAESYVNKVRSHVDSHIMRMKQQEQARKAKPKPANKPEVGPAGDSFTPPTDEFFKKMERVKRDCYRKIEANLNMLKSIDDVTSEMYNNQLCSAADFRAFGK